MKKKPIQLNKSLSLNKETVSKLNEEQLGEVAGGQEEGIFSITCNNNNLQEAEEMAAASCIACSCNGR